MNILKKSLKELNESKRNNNPRRSNNNRQSQNSVTSLNNKENDESEKYFF